MLATDVCTQPELQLPAARRAGRRDEGFGRGVHVLWTQICSTVRSSSRCLQLLAVSRYLSAGTSGPGLAGDCCISLTGDLESRLIP